MKVLYIVHSTILGGATISFFNMIDGLRKRGVTPIVLCPDQGKQFTSMLKDRKIPFYVIPIIMSIYPPYTSLMDIMKFPYRLIRLLFNKWKSLNIMLTLIDIIKPDIIHTNTGTVHEGYQAAIRRNLPHVWHIREYQTLDFGLKIFPSKGHLCKEFSNSYTVFITKKLQSYFGLSGMRSFVIYNGILHKDEIYYDIKKKYFLCASRIEETKGHLDVIKAFAIFHKNYPEYKLIILGFGDPLYIQLLKDTSKRLECDSSVLFMGYKQDVLSYMKNATALIVASKHEGFGRMTAESCFAGSLVIGRNTDGTKEILSETGGFLFETVEDLVKQMKEVVSLTEPEYRQKVLFAQQTAVRLYSIEQNIENVLNLYDKILDK